jgi:hypothetical protein
MNTKSLWFLSPRLLLCAALALACALQCLGQDKTPAPGSDQRQGTQGKNSPISIAASKTANLGAVRAQGVPRASSLPARHAAQAEKAAALSKVATDKAAADKVAADKAATDKAATDKAAADRQKESAVVDWLKDADGCLQQSITDDADKISNLTALLAVSRAESVLTVSGSPQPKSGCTPGEIYQDLSDAENAVKISDFATADQQLQFIDALNPAIKAFDPNGSTDNLLRRTMRKYGSSWMSLLSLLFSLTTVGVLLLMLLPPQADSGQPDSVSEGKIALKSSLYSLRKAVESSRLAFGALEADRNKQWNEVQRLDLKVRELKKDLDNALNQQSASARIEPYASAGAWTQAEPADAEQPGQTYEVLNQPALGPDPVRDYNRFIGADSGQAEDYFYKQYPAERLQRVSCQNLDEYRSRNALLTFEEDARGNFLVVGHKGMFYLLPSFFMTLDGARKSFEGVYQYPESGGPYQIRRPAMVRPNVGTACFELDQRGVLERG